MDRYMTLRETSEKREKLLLVEDDIEISQMLKDYLKAENYEVICAADGKEACEKFDRGGQVKK